MRIDNIKLKGTLITLPFSAIIMLRAIVKVHLCLIIRGFKALTFVSDHTASETRKAQKNLLLSCYILQIKLL